MQINSNQALVQQFYGYLQFRYLLKNLSRNTNFLRYFKSKNNQHLGIFGEVTGIAKGEHLGTRCYHLRLRPLNDKEEIIVVVDEIDYIQHCSKEMNSYFERKSADREKELFFANLEPGFDNNGKVKYLFSAAASVLVVSQQLRFQVLKPLADMFDSEVTTEIDFSKDNGLEGGLISLGDLRNLVTKSCKSRYLIWGVVQILCKSCERFNDLYRTSYDVLLHQPIYRTEQSKAVSWRLIMEVIHPNEHAQPCNELKPWHNYIFLNPDVIPGQFLDIKYQVKLKENRPGDNTSQFFLLEERDQPEVLIMRNKSLKLTRISDIPTTAYTRDIYKIHAIVNQPELMIVRIVCRQCRRIKLNDKCEICSCEEFELNIWAQCLIQDFNSCAYLNLNTEFVIDFYNLNEETLGLLRQLAMKGSDSKLVVPGIEGRRPNRELIPIYQQMKPLMESRVMLVTPFIDMHKTQRKTITYDQAVDLEIGFKTQRQFQETLKVFPNGTVIGSVSIPSFRVVEVLPRSETFSKLQ